MDEKAPFGAISADTLKVGDILEKRGYKESDIENILYLNWKRFFEKNLPKS